MRALILDSDALSRLARATPTNKPGSVHSWVRAAANLGSRVLVPAAVLAEQYRGGGHDQAIDSFLSRHEGIEVIDTDRALARRVGHLLAGIKAGSELHVDACVVATVIAVGGGVILTSDPDDLKRLAAAYPQIDIVTTTSSLGCD
jgi:predicted nucleic acid-binding protein